MKVMWVVNTIFPDLAEFLGQQKPVIGGWMYGLAKGLSNRGIELVVVTAKKDTTVNDKKIKGISYYVLANKKDTIVYDSTLEKKWEIIVSQIKPDVIHIHGTELSHGLALVNKFPNLNYIASIQGLIGVYSR